MQTEISLQEWKASLLSAATLAEAAPWQTLSDSQVFGFIHPQTGEKQYCCLMGMNGDFRALAVYPGKLGWQSFHQINVTEQGNNQLDSILSQRCIMLVFEDPSALEQDDQMLLNRLGLDPKAWPLVPVFRSYLPSHLPWSLDAQELETMQYAVEALHVLLANLQHNDFQVPEKGTNEKGELLFLFKDELDGWLQSWQQPDASLNLSPDLVEWDAETVSALKALPQNEETWLLQYFYHDRPDYPTQGRPYFLRAFVVMDIATQEVISLSLIQPSEWPHQLGVVVAETMRRSAHKPSQVVVGQKEAFQMFRPAMQSIGLGTFLDQEMDLREDLASALGEWIAGIDQNQ